MFSLLKVSISKGLLSLEEYDNRTSRADILLPPIILISSFYFSTFGVIFTFLFLTILMPLAYLACHYLIFKRKSTVTWFYSSWTISSYVLLLLIFETIAVAFLEITVRENFSLLLLSTTSVVLIFYLRLNNRTYAFDKFGNFVRYNPWIASNITLERLWIYVISLVCAICALLFGVYLHITTICHTYDRFGLLIPDDCSEVYYDISLSLTFVSAIYAGMLAAGLFYSLIFQLYWMCSSHQYSQVFLNSE